MNPADLIVLAALAVFAWTGWRQGFVAGLLSFGGFLVGGLGAALLLPRLITVADMPSMGGAFLLALGILACAVLGQTLASVLGRRLRSGITWRGARAIDSAGGAALNVVALMLVLWIIASAVGLIPDMPLAREIRSSVLLSTIDRAVPDAARNVFSGLRSAVDASGLPRVFSGFGQYAGPEVAPPDGALLRDPAVRAAWPSLAKVRGIACNVSVTGSGFVYAPDHVLTNAHVVAGVGEARVSIPGDLYPYVGTVVAIDTRIDLAVIYVPGLPAPPLSFAAKVPSTGGSAVVAGFPGGGELVATPARIRARIDARGEDIYRKSGVVREVFSIRGNVVPGNSGGPLLSPRGRVYGVVFASGLGDPETGYAITAAQAADVAEAGRTATQPVDTGACRRT